MMTVGGKIAKKKKKKKRVNDKIWNLNGETPK